jgi:hypothetical protein
MLGELALELSDVLREVTGRTVAQHGPLAGADAADPDREQQRDRERDRRAACGGERDDADGGGEVVHADRLMASDLGVEQDLLDRDLVRGLVVVRDLLGRHGLDEHVEGHRLTRFGRRV